MQTKDLIEYKAIMIMTTHIDVESKSNLVSESFNWESIAHAAYAYLHLYYYLGR